MKSVVSYAQFFLKVLMSKREYDATGCLFCLGAVVGIGVENSGIKLRVTPLLEIRVARKCRWKRQRSRKRRRAKWSLSSS